MDGDRGARLLALRCDVLAEATGEGVRDLLSYFDPDLVYVVREELDVRVASRVERAFDGPVVTGGRRSGDRRVERIGGVRVVFSESLSAIESSGDALGGAGERTTYVVCDDVRATTDAVALTASIDGIDRLARRVAADAGTTTFLTGALEASYDHVWETDVGGTPVRVPVRGLAPLRRAGTPEVACLTCGRGGTVAVDSVPADSFGLGALDGVGPTTARRLRDGGFRSRAHVADARADELTAIRGIGESTARAMRRSARALDDGRIVRCTDADVPAHGYTPLFVDIETDGLNPSVIPLIGAYDPERDEYVDFVDTDPSLDDPGTATREFVSWLAAEYDRPSLVTWNGYEFDYPHLGRFVAGHAPAYREFWDDDVFRYDLYDWAVREGHAVLPGRTNRLDDVAAALGCERVGDAAALDGKTLARAITRGLRSPDRDFDVDWGAARAYCEADVRELATVYDEMAAADPGRERADEPDTETTQTGLMDF